jgi:RND family efflux transporter MFP subunit
MARPLKSGFVILAVFALGALAVIAIASFRAARAEDQAITPVIRPAVVRAEALDIRTYEVTESFHGIIQANVRVDMAFQIAGRVTQLGADKSNPIRENDTVKTGDVLAELEPQRYRAAVDAARAKVLAAQGDMNAAAAQVRDAEAKLDNAEKELARVRVLVEKKAIAPQELDKAEMNHSVAKAALENVKAKLASVTAVYTAGQAEEQIANANLQDATLKAPMPAMVAAVPVELGQMVQPSQPVVTLVDLSKVKLVVGVVERKLPVLRRGQKVKIDVQALAANRASMKDPEQAKALGKPRNGVITIVPPAADPVTGLFNVEIELDNADGLLRPGMIGKASVTVLEKKAIAIPADAVTKVGDQHYAYFVGLGYETGLDMGGLGKTSFTVPTRVARKLPINPVAIDHDFFLITDLPDTLDQLVVEGQTHLADGQPVRVLEEAVAHTETSP